MSWTYSGWLQKKTDKLKHQELGKHLTELNDAITYKVDADGQSIDPSLILKLYEDLSVKYESLYNKIERNQCHRKGGLI